MSHRILISFSVLMAFLVFTPNAPAEQVTHEEYSFVVPESCFPFPEQTHQNFEAKFRQDSVNGFPDAHFVYGHLSSGETRYPATIVVKWYANRRIPDKVLESMPRIKVNEVSGDHDVFPCFPEKQFDDSTSTIWEESGEHAPMMCQKATRVTQRGSLQILCISGTVATREALVAFHEMVNSVVIAPEFAYKHKYSSPPPPVSAPAVSIYIDKNPSSSFPTFSFPTFFPGWYIVLVVIGLVSTFRSMNQRSSASRLPSRSLPNDSTMEFLEAASQPDPEDQVPDNTEGEGIPKPN